MALDFGQPGIDHAVEGLAVTDREAQDQDFTLLVGVSSQAFIVTLHTQKKRGKSVRADLFISMWCVGFSFPHFPFAQNALAQILHTLKAVMVQPAMTVDILSVLKI